MQSEAAELKAQIETGSARISELETANEDYRTRLGQFSNVMPLTWVGAAIIVCLIVDFLAGLWWVDRQSRKRHGGIRIY